MPHLATEIPCLTEEVIDRFWNKVNKSTPETCWFWTGAISSQGYGSIWHKGKSLTTHRLAWRICFGELDPNLCVLHSCDTPSCVNPNHLFLGSHQDNIRDCVSKNRLNSRKGELNPKHKLTLRQVQEIRDHIANGLSNREIADMFSFSIDGIRSIRNKTNWRWLP